MRCECRPRCRCYDLERQLEAERYFRQRDKERAALEILELRRELERRDRWGD